MTKKNQTTSPELDAQAPQPNPDLKSLDRLVGTWKQSGGIEGEITQYRKTHSGALLAGSAFQRRTNCLSCACDCFAERV